MEIINNIFRKSLAFFILKKISVKRTSIPAKMELLVPPQTIANIDKIKKEKLKKLLFPLLINSHSKIPKRDNPIEEKAIGLIKSSLE
ncbi:hypothetical protein APR42_01940 [Salegentibacter mishustinae]|uniref:Uncharacterized protein n=1 Tax=Salegentibacter mishustinae TaxID=270918 RepID=A0A0Q9ZLL1_9FLAO|nr:hypothetical protein APR42_01940 [Salegentibacter mishustinae]